MKKRIIYILVLIGIIFGISIFNMQVLDMSNATYTQKSEYTDYFPVPKVGDLYVFQTPDSTCNFLKIHNQLSTDSFTIIYGKEPVEKEEAQSTLWANLASKNNVFFNSYSKVPTNLDGLKNFFLQKDFMAIYRVTKKDMSDMPDYEAPPWYISFIGSFFSFPIIVLLIFLTFWFINGIGRLFSQKDPHLASKVGFLPLIIMGILFISNIVHSDFIFPDFWVAGLYGFASVVGPLLLYQLLNKRYFSKQTFADQEALKFLTLLLSGVFISLAAFQFCAFAYRSLSEPELLGPLTIIPYESLLFPAALGWTAIATGNFLNNLRQHFIQLKNQEKILAVAQKNELSSKAELDALQARINPHFLYNSLNSIASLAQIDPKKTEEMAIALSQFYKYSTNRAEEHLTSIGAEIELIKIYLDIEKIRFGERLQYEIDTSQLTQEWQIPRFLLQPLVENAVKYGYNETRNQIAINITISDNDEGLLIKISDNGQPFSDHMKIGYGLSSVQKKLQLLFANRHTLSFINQPEKGVIIEIKKLI